MLMVQHNTTLFRRDEEDYGPREIFSMMEVAYSPKFRKTTFLNLDIFWGNISTLLKQVSIIIGCRDIRWSVPSGVHFRRHFDK